MSTVGMLTQSAPLFNSGWLSAVLIFPVFLGLQCNKRASWTTIFQWYNDPPLPLG